MDLQSYNRSVRYGRLTAILCVVSGLLLAVLVLDVSSVLPRDASASYHEAMMGVDNGRLSHTYVQTALYACASHSPSSCATGVVPPNNSALQLSRHPVWRFGLVEPSRELAVVPEDRPPIVS